MQHPLVENIDNLSLEEVMSKLNSLREKQRFVSRTGNADLMRQLLMVIECYEGRYQKLMAEFMDQARGNLGDITKKIDISS